jgi:DNA adenine methylase
MRSLIKWEGSKFKHLQYIYPHIPKDFNTYIEPFVGSGALFLKVMPKKWIINDVNKLLVILWRLVQNNPDAIIKKIKSFSKVFDKLNHDDRLIMCKKLTNKLNTDEITNESAVIFLIMKSIVFMGYLFVKNKYTFGSLHFDSNTENFPNNKHEYFERIKKISTFLNNTNGKILCNDYTLVLKLAKKNDFVFLDPPYTEKYTYQFSYNKDESININFLTSLLNEVKKLDKRGVYWLMTQADTPEVRKIFEDYEILEFPVFRRSQLKYKNELLIKNYDFHG